MAISEACWTNCLLDIACWTLPPSRSLCLLPSAQVLKEDVLSEMPQCCCDACIKAHDRASGVWSGYGLGSLGYGLGTRNAGRQSAQVSHLLQYISGTSAMVWVTCRVWVHWVRFGCALNMPVALLATFTGTFASGYHSGRSSAQSPSSSTFLVFTSFTATEPSPSDQNL